jgi:energy-coupling factor transporter ATP-binding protein EcfA2
VRLRYLHLPRCGPLTDTSVVFGHEDLVARALDLPRKGSLNFLVGVNGTGKSSLLRALYRIFRTLNLRQWPELPVTLAWDRAASGELVTTLLHWNPSQDATPFFTTMTQVPVTARRGDWQEITEALGNKQPHPLAQTLELVTGPEAIANSLLFARLPKRLIAYTSGAHDPWAQLEQPEFHARDEDKGRYQIDDERPQGWSMNREWEEEQPIHLSTVLTRYALRAGSKLETLAGVGQVGHLSQDTAAQLSAELAPLEAIRQKLFSNRMPRSERLDESYFRIEPRHLRFAGLTLALWQAARDLSGRNQEQAREELRRELMIRHRSDPAPSDARRVLNEIDWFWPTHLSVTYRDADDRVSPRQHQELLCLLALADKVIAQPGNRQRAVISLGPSENIDLSARLREVFPFGLPSSDIEFIAERVDACRTGAEAVLRIFSADSEIDSTPLDVFSRLRDWERTGLLENITLTVKRLHRPQSPDGEADDIVVTYDQLSDGEQMLLGRMGLLFLLRGQDGSLLLLDEPETHFNDKWKREIVDMIDHGLLNSTEAQVLVATHTSIVLTDAFAAEVTVLDKKDGETTARGVAGGLFGTDPGEVAMNLFRSESSVGSRALALLDQLLQTDWQGREKELDEILKVLGSSFHRAELRAILKQLRSQGDGAAPA